MDKQDIQERQQKILDLVREFCGKKLNEDYFELSERLVKKLGRKKSVPMATGKIEVWAAAIIHALGTINFLFDKSIQPYVSIDEINEFFGTTKSTTGNKSKQIREMLNLQHFDKEFSTGQIKSENPFNNFVMVDGFIVSLDTLSEHHQEAVRQARAQGEDISFTTR